MIRKVVTLKWLLLNSLLMLCVFVHSYLFASTGHFFKNPFSVVEQIEVMESKLGFLWLLHDYQNGK